jgi:Bacteriophage HK97-gp10, putative tail-component
VATAFRLEIDVRAAQRIGLDHAQRVVTDTTRRVLNRAIVLTPVDTGRLRAGNQSRVRVEGSRAVGEVFNETSYAPPVHNGSRAYTITPRRKKALKFVVGGEVVFAAKVRMPARRGRPWLARALREIAGSEGYRLTGI